MTAVFTANRIQFIGAFFLLPLLICSLSGMAQKTDLVILKNGDHITGEVKKLELEILQFKTSYMSTAQIKWHHVSKVIAPDKRFEIEMHDKTVLYGSLDSTNMNSALRIVTENGEYNVRSEDVVVIHQVRQKFWRRFSGNLGAGANYTKASDVLQYNYSSELSYMDEDYFAKFSINTINTQEADQPKRTKQDVILNLNRDVRSVEFIALFFSNQRNTELGIKNRNMVGGGYGVKLLQSSIARIQGAIGVTANRETALEDGHRTDNAEGYFVMDARVFKYTDPEVYLDGFVKYYPSITVAGRNRVEAEIKVRLEILSDLFIEVKFYDNYDSKPVSETASTNDYGILSGVSYTFGL